MSGTEAEAVEEFGSLARSSWLAQVAFLYNPGPPARRWPRPHWAGPFISTIRQENAPQANLMATVSSSQMTVACVKLKGSLKPKQNDVMAHNGLSLQWRFPE